MPILPTLRDGGRSCVLPYSLSRKKEKEFAKLQSKELLGGFHQKSDITIIVFGKDEFSSARSK